MVLPEPCLPAGKRPNFFLSALAEASACFFPFLVSAKWLCERSAFKIFFTFCSASPCRIMKYVLPDVIARNVSSAMEPTVSHFSHLVQRHTGKGVPQYRSRENAQSFFSLSHPPNRPSCKCSGCQ